MELSRKQRAALVALGVVLAVVSPVALAAAEDFVSGFYQTQGNIHHNASDGPEVIQTKNYNLRSGNPFTDNSYNLSTETNGWLNVSTLDADSGGMVVTVDEINGTWTNVSGVAAPNGNITLQPSDKNFTRVGGGINTFKFKDIKVNDGQVDLRYTAGSETTIVVETNASDGTQYGLVNTETEAGLDVAAADSDGTVDFTEVPAQSSETSVRVEELGTLTMREENPPHNKVTGSSATVTFYGLADEDPTIVRRSDDDGDGVIELTGLPTDEQFAARVEAPNHHNRTVLIPDLSQQENVFLLNSTNTTAFDISFSIEDPTGQFTGEEASITVQRAINKSKFDTGGFTWLAIAGDRTGAANVLSVTLESQTRYRLRVADGSGDVRILGGYTVTGDDSVVLRPAAPDINVTDVETFNWNVTYVNTSSGGRIEFEYYDPANSTTDVDLYIHEVGNESNDFTVQTVSGPIGYTKITQTLTENEAAKNWEVEWNATYDGSEVGATVVVGQTIEEIVQNMAPWLRNGIAVLVVILTGGLFSVANAKVGAIVTAFVGGGFYMIGWLPAAAGGAIMIALFIAIGWKVAGG